MHSLGVIYSSGSFFSVLTGDFSSYSSSLSSSELKVPEEQLS